MFLLYHSCQDGHLGVDTKWRRRISMARVRNKVSSDAKCRASSHRFLGRQNTGGRPPSCSRTHRVSSYCCFSCCCSKTPEGTIGIPPELNMAAFLRSLPIIRSSAQSRSVRNGKSKQKKGEERGGGKVQLDRQWRQCLFLDAYGGFNLLFQEFSALVELFDNMERNIETLSVVQSRVAETFVLGRKIVELARATYALCHI